MRILFVHEKFGAFGGAEANILATARALKDRGHSVGLLHGPRTGKGEAAWQDTFQHRFLFGSGIRVATEMQACEYFRPEVIYVHKLADLEALENLLASGVPVIRMVHDHDLYCMRSYRYNYVTRHICDRALSPYCLFPCGAFVARNRAGVLPIKWNSYNAKLRELEKSRNCYRMIVATQFMREQLLRNQFDPAQIEIHAPVPPGGDLTWTSSFNARNYLIYAGQIVRGKGVDVLLEALAQVRLPFNCLIFGEGAHRPHCERLMQKLGLENRVTFKGYVAPDEIAVYYRQCSAFLMSSVWPEPFGAVGLEAMRFGLPVVAFDAGGIREWLIDRQNGFLVPWMDRVAFAARIEDLLRDKELARQMGENGRQLVAEHYGFSKYISGLEQLFAGAVEPTPLAIS